MKFRRRKNLLKGLILSFATAAIVVSGAQASYHTQKAQEARSALNQTYTPAALRALALRSEAMNQQYQSIASDRALELRSEGLNKLYQSQQVALRPDDRSGIRGSEPTAVTPDLSEVQRHVRSDEALSQASIARPDDRAGFRGPGIVQTPELVSVKGGGFDWKDAGIGAGTTFGIVLVLMSGLAFSRRRSGLAV
jgi:hypothetical protein